MNFKNIFVFAGIFLILTSPVAANDLLAELARARAATAKYHNLAQAEADGYQFDSCHAAEACHWFNWDLYDGTFDPAFGEVIKLTESNYWFRLGAHQQWLIDYIEANPAFIQPDYRRNEVLGFLKNNTLEDLCISRPKARLSWGIPLPFDPEAKPTPPQRNLRFLEGWFRRAIRKGRLRVKNPAAAAFAFLSTIHSFVFLQQVVQALETPMELGEYLDAVLDVWTRGAIVAAPRGRQR